MIVILVTCITILFGLYHLFNPRKKSRTPPGPLGLPIVGTLFSVLKPAHLAFLKWSLKYGPIIHTRIGFKNVLILNEVKLIREAFNDKVFSGRPDSWTLSVVARGKHGVVASDGQVWTDQRRFLLKNLREFGFGKQSMEGLIMDEVLEMTQWIKKNVGTPVSVDKRLIMATVNSLWTIVTGKRFEHDDPVLVNLTEAFNAWDGLKAVLSLYFPPLFRIFTTLSTFFPFLTPGPDDALTNVITDHLASPVDENNPRDVVDIYLHEVKNTKDVSSSFYGLAGRVSLRAIVGEIFGAGSGTTSSTLTWCILYLTTHPQVQLKVQKEIDDCVGAGRNVSIVDKSKMPYVEAVMHEVLRFSCIFPVLLVHNTMGNTTFQGYQIEKDTLVYSNIYAVHFSEEIWGDPLNFRPERFLSPDGKTLTGKENVLSFSVGRRQCIGETLARDTFFLFLTNIFQKFKVEVDPKNPNPSLEKVPGVTEDAKPFKVVFKSRS